MSRQVSPSIRNETSLLGAVLVHSPGLEFDWMIPGHVEPYSCDETGARVPNPEYLLFDDLVLLSQLRDEHKALTGVYEAVVGQGRVVQFRDLLHDVLQDHGARAECIEASVIAEESSYPGPVAPDLRRRLGDLSPAMLARAFLHGSLEDRRPLFRGPSPNLLFARDLAAVVGESIVLSYARHGARRREMALARIVFTRHELLSGASHIDIGEGRAAEGTEMALEGGDVLVLGEGVVAIGVGTRTTQAGALALAASLFEEGWKSVVLAYLPLTRGAMHLDTVFSMVGEKDCLVYAPAVEVPASDGGVRVGIVHRGTPTRVLPVESSFLDAVRGLGVPLDAIWCGGTNPRHQAREQWSDGANAFALAPGCVVCYARNEKTLQELNRRGYRIVTPHEFQRNAYHYMGVGSGKTVVALPGGELSRGRGGPRCLTLPLCRSE